MHTRTRHTRAHTHTHTNTHTAGRSRGISPIYVCSKYKLNTDVRRGKRVYSPFIKKMGPGSGELPYLAIFVISSYTVQCCELLKFEKRVQKGCLNWGSNRRMHCCRRGQTAWILMVFPNSVLLGQNLAEILFLLWLAFWTKKLQKHNWKRIPYGNCRKKF